MKKKKKDNLYPIYFGGEKYNEDDVHPLFAAMYWDRDQMDNGNGGIYIADGFTIYPDGSSEDYE